MLAVVADRRLAVRRRRRPRSRRRRRPRRRGRGALPSTPVSMIAIGDPRAPRGVPGLADAVVGRASTRRSRTGVGRRGGSRRAARMPGRPAPALPRDSPRAHSATVVDAVVGALAHLRASRLHALERAGRRSGSPRARRRARAPASACRHLTRSACRRPRCRRSRRRASMLLAVGEVRLVRRAVRVARRRILRAARRARPSRPSASRVEMAAVAAGWLR